MRLPDCAHADSIRATRGGRGEAGTALLSVVLAMLLIGVVSAMMLATVRADVAAGIKQQQAVQVFNLAEAGVHYALAKLQLLPGDDGDPTRAATYTGENLTVTDDLAGGVGQISIVVQCLDGTSPAANPSDPCAGTYANFRRVRSTGTLPVAGPMRVVTAIVQGNASSTSHYAACAYNGMSLAQGVYVYGDVGSNADITLARGGSPTRICDSVAGGACSGPASPPQVAYSGSAYAVGSIRCGGGACNSAQIEGTIGPNQPTGSVCPAVTLTPPSSPGSAPLQVHPGTTTLDPSVNYGAVALDSTGTSTCPANVNLRTTLVIPSGSDPNATVTVLMRTLWMGKCSRLLISGVGRVALWILEPTTQGLKAEQDAVFGATLDGTPVSGDRLTVNVMSQARLTATSGCLSGGETACPAVKINQAGLLAGTFIVPGDYAGLELNQSNSVAASGAMLAGQIQFDQGSSYVWDPRSRIGQSLPFNFNQLRAWKDQ
jgi:hypothetical protein